MHRSMKGRKQRKSGSARAKAPHSEKEKVDVNAHPSAPVKHNYYLYRDRLSPETIEKVEAHLAVCKSCRVEAESTIADADYFRRLDKTPIDC